MEDQPKRSKPGRKPKNEGQTELKPIKELIGLGRYLEILRGDTPQSHFAAKLQTSPSNLSRIEAGCQNVGILTLVRLLKELGGDIQDAYHLVATAGSRQLGEALAYRRLSQQREAFLSEGQHQMIDTVVGKQLDAIPADVQRVLAGQKEFIEPNPGEVAPEPDESAT